MSNLINMLLQAQIDPQAVSKIHKQINEISKNAQAIKINIEVDDKVLKNITDISKKLQSQIQNVAPQVDLSTSVGQLDKFSQKTERAEGGLNKLLKVTRDIAIENNRAIKTIDTYDKETGKLIQTTDELTINYKKQREELSKIEKLQSKNLWGISKEKLDNIGKESDAIKQLNNYYRELEKSTAIASKQQEELNNKVNLFKQRMLGGNGLQGEMDIFASKQKGKYDKTTFSIIKKDIEELSAKTPDATNSLKQLGVQWNSLKQTTMQSGSIMAKTIENMGKFLRFYLAGGLLVGFVRDIRAGIESVKELDKSLTELSKVSDLSGSQLKVFTDRAYEAGRTIARTGKEVIDATAEFKRAGYEIEQAFELSQQALLLTNIGDGITDVKEASSSLIAILKGFKMEASETAHIVDALNEVSNNYAIDTNNLTEIMKRASGTIAQTGTSYEELLGLSVGGFESLRNAEMVASGINMISQRLRGMTEDGEAVEGLIPKIQEAFDKYTKGAVSIIDKQNGGLHSTYEILSQLQKVYPTLSDEARAYLNEAVAGNRQNKVLIAILENWQNVEKATLSATNSLGSANAENEKYLNSIEGKSKRLTSSLQVMWKNTINSEAIKFFIDLSNSIVVAVDKVGLLNVALSGLWLYLSLSGKVALLPVIDGLAIAFGKWAISMGVSATASGVLATALSTLSPLLAFAVVVGGIKLIDALTTSLKEQKEIVETLSGKIQSLQSEYDSLNANENRTKEQEQYLELLDQELDKKKELLKYETKRLVQMEFFEQSSYKYKQDAGIEDTGISRIKNSIDELNKLKKELNETSDIKAFDKLNEKILKLELSLTDSLKTIKGYIDVLGDEAPQSLIDLADVIEDVVIKQEDLDEKTNNINSSIQDVTKSVTDLYKEVSTAVDQYDLFSQALKELNEEGQVSKSTLDKLIEVYPNIIQLTGLQKDKMIELMNASRDKRRQMIDDEIASAKAASDSAVVQILAAKDIADALTKLANIKLQMKFIDAGLSFDDPAIDEQMRINTEKAREALAVIEKTNVKIQALEGMRSLFGEVDNKYKDKSKSTKDNRQFLESIDAEIRAIKLKNDYLLTTEKSLQEQLKLAKDLEGIEGLNEQYRITGKLIEHNKKMLQSFKTEQDLVHARANEIRKQNSKYNIDSWFDSNAEATVEYINAYNKATKSQQEEMSKLFNQIQALKKAWMESATEVEKIVDVNKQLVIEQDKLLDQQYELARTNWIKEQNAALKERRDRLQALQQIEDAIVQIIRKRGEEEKKVLDEAHRAEMDSLEKRHQERKKKYAEELDEFKKMIQAKIDALDEQWEEEDYLEQLNKEREEANRLQREIDVLSLDDSLTARNKTIELRKQLADQNEKIAKMQQKKERDTLKKSLQDQLKDKEKDAKDKEKIADNLYDNEKKRLEEEYKINKEFLDRKYSDEQVYAEARESIMRGTVEIAEGMFVDIYDAYKDFENKFGRGMGVLGDIIKKDFLDQLEKAQQAVRDLEYTSRARDDYSSDYRPRDDEWDYRDPRDDKGSSSGSYSGKLSDMSKNDYNRYRSNKYAWEIYDAQPQTEDIKRKKQIYENANQKLRDKYGISSDLYTYSDLKDVPWEDLKKLGFDNGGKIIGTGSTLVDFHGTKNKPEWIFNDSQLKDIVRDVTLSTIKIAIPGIPKIPNVTQRESVVLQIDNLINVEGNVTKETMPLIKSAGNDIAEALKNLNKGGVFRPIKI